jgi:purine-binding chemotaxis protein CheW
MSDPREVQDLLDEINRLQEHRATDDEVPARRVLGVLLGTELYGLPIAGIRGIARLQPITFVPGAPGMIVGVTSLRGQMLPVVDLRAVLGIEDGPRPAESATRGRARIVVVSQGDIQAGLLVDGVTEVHEVRAAVEPPLGTRTGTPLTDGQVPLGGRVLVLINLPNLFTRLTG